MNQFGFAAAPGLPTRSGRITEYLCLSLSKHGSWDPFQSTANSNCVLGCLPHPMQAPAGIGFA